MKIPTTFLRRVLLNEALQSSVVVERDCEVIHSRFEHEGMSFLTITLPILDKALVQGLAEGRITPSMFEGFKPLKRGGKLPALLSGFFMRVFEVDGSLKDEPCIASIRAIRQVTRIFKKVELPCSDDRIAAAFGRYKSNDESICGTAGNPDVLHRIAGYLWSDLEEFSGELYCSPGIFGSGASAERLSFNERHSITKWPSRSENSFPVAYHTSHREDDTETFSGIEIVDSAGELPVRVVQVPKTLETPRIISVEPSYMMLMQQSIAKPLMAYLESERFKYKSIRFTDQSVNREMARIGSENGSFATIDLKDASDLVSNDLVKSIFSVCPGFLDLIQDCRSTRAQLPDNSVITLRKFASQGSAMCFPIEAMVFFTIIMYSGVRQSGKRPSMKLLSAIAANVAVYGDDIIVPTEMAAGVMEDLESFGLKVNHNKSFFTGSFRESCGGDYYKGVDVTPAYCTMWDFTGNSRDSRVFSSYMSLTNQFYMKGLWHASQYIRDHVQTVFGPIQSSTRPVGVATFASVNNDSGLRYDSTTSGWKLKGFFISTGRKADPIQDVRAGMLLAFGRSTLRERIDSMDTSRGQSSFSRRRGPDGLCPMGLRFVNEPLQVTGGDEPPNDQQRCSHRSVEDIDGSWLEWLNSSTRGRTNHLKSGIVDIDFLSSVDSYASNTKRRWSPTRVGLPGW